MLIKPASVVAELLLMAALSVVNSPPVLPVGKRQPDGQIDVVVIGAGVVALAQAAVA